MARNHRVTLERIPNQDDLAGATGQGESYIAQFWAEIIPISSKERFYMGQDQVTATHKIRILYTSLVKPRMKITYDSRSFKVIGILDTDEKKRKLELTCQEVQ